MNPFYLFDSYLLIRKGFLSGDGYFVVLLYGLVGPVEISVKLQQAGVAELKR